MIKMSLSLLRSPVEFKLPGLEKARRKKGHPNVVGRHGGKVLGVSCLKGIPD